LAGVAAAQGSQYPARSIRWRSRVGHDNALLFRLPFTLPIPQGRNQKGVQMKQKPVHEIRNGCIKASIWLNAGKDGKSDHHSITISRSYKLGEEWRQTTSFFPADLPKLAEVLAQAGHWFSAQERSSATAVASSASRSRGTQTTKQKGESS
jgi:hypothetical protein